MNEIAVHTLDFQGKVFIPEAPQLNGTVGGASIISFPIKGLDVIWMIVPSSGALWLPLLPLK